MNRRGNLFDGFTIISYFVIFVLVCGIIGYVISLYNGAISADSSIPSEAKTFVSDINSDYPVMIDGIGIFILILLPLASAALAFLNNINPIMFWVSIFYLVFVELMGIFYNWVWNSVLSSSTALSDYLTQLTITHFIMSNFAIYSLFVMTVIIAGVYLRMRGGYV